MVTSVVLVHGAGHSARVWHEVQVALGTRPSFAVDVLGRDSHPYDITKVSASDAAVVAANDVRDEGIDRAIVVAHSIGGVIAPTLASRLGARCVHVVFVAGICAPQGEQAVDYLHPDKKEYFVKGRARLAEEYRGHVFASTDRAVDGRAAAALGLKVFSDAKAAQSIDSLNLMFQPVDWSGVDVERSYVRCLNDKIQTPEMQERLRSTMGVSETFDLDSGHNAAITAPYELAAVIENIAARFD